MADPISPREWIKDQADRLGVEPEALLIQSKKRDPMYAGTSGQHDKAAWAADLWEDAVELRLDGDRRIHPRGIHYYIVENPITVTSPSARTSWNEYVNSEVCYDYLREALEEARKLDYIPLDGIIDDKHPQRTITEYGDHRTDPAIHDLLVRPDGLTVPDIPDVDATASTQFNRGDRDALADHLADQIIRQLRREITIDRARQEPFHVEVWCEKTIPGGERVTNIFPDLGVNVLVEGEGDLTYGLASDFAHRLRTASKPAIVFYLSDFDPKGHEMPEKMAAKLAWMQQRGDLAERVILEPLALTREQVRQHDFPRKPIPEAQAKKDGSGARAHNTLVDDWEQRMGEGAVEINVFEHHPETFIEILEDRISTVYDDELDRKNREAREAWADDLRDEIHDVVQDADDLDDVEDDLYEWIEEFNDALADAKDHLQQLQNLTDRDELDRWRGVIAEIHDAIDVPEFEIPDGEAPEPSDPLFDSDRAYQRNLERVKRHRNEPIPWRHGTGGDDRE